MIEYDRETYDNVITELKPMLEEHQVEVGAYPEILELDPNWEFYEDAVAQSKIVIFTVRDDNILIGYNIFRIAPHMHYRNSIWACMDVLYLEPEYRHSELTIDFCNYCEVYLAEMLDVEVMTYNMPVSAPFKGLMNALFMDEAEHCYTKHIG